MSDLPPPPTGEDRTRFQVDRLAFFSDAVFAIAITLLALNIHAAPVIGPVDEAALAKAAMGMIPRLMGFLLSFLVVGSYWRSHHRLFRWIRDYDSGLIRINLWLLLFVSLIPAPTTFYSDYADYRTPLIVYAASLFILGVNNALLWSYAARHPALLYPKAPMFELKLGAGRSLLIPAISLLAVVLSFHDLWLARLSLLLIPVWIVLYTRLARRLARQHHVQPAP